MNFFVLLLYLILGILLFTIPGFILSYIIFKKDKKEVNFLERIVIGFTTTLPILVINYLIVFYLFNNSPNIFVGLYLAISFILIFFALVRNEIILKKCKLFHKQTKIKNVKKEEVKVEAKNKATEKKVKKDSSKDKKVTNKTNSKKSTKKIVDKKKTSSKKKTSKKSENKN
jgi:hypothetical protein